MFLPRLFLSGGLLLGLPLFSQAQATTDAAPRFYGGIGIYSSHYNPLGNPYGLGTTVPAQLTLGYHLRPRLTVQASAAYSSNADNYSGTVRDYATGNTGEYFNDYRNRYFTFSLLGRYALTRQAAHRLQVEAVAGATLERHTYRGTGANPDFSSPYPGTSTFFDLHSANNIYLISLGPGVRYRLLQRLDVVADYLLNIDVEAAAYPRASYAVGLRYRFGQR